MPEPEARRQGLKASLLLRERLSPWKRFEAPPETVAPAAEEMPLVLAVEPQALAWAQHTVQFLQIGELPEEQEKAEKVARRSAMYQFVDDVLYRKRPNGVKLMCIPQEVGLEQIGRASCRERV